MRYLLFGTGDCYERYKRWFQDHEIVALLDNSEEKQGKILDGHEVVSPSEGVQRDFDAVIILSFYMKEMKAQLINMGVEEERIFHFYDLHKLIDVRKNSRALIRYGDFSFDKKAKKRAKKILLLNQNLSIGGPAFTLFDTARILKKNGYHVVYGSMIDGPLRHLLLQENIPVIIDENLLIGTMRAAEWVMEYDLVFCNAINFYVFLSDRDTSIPMIWWLHDSAFFYEGVDKQVISKISGTNLDVYAVGNVPKAALKACAPELEIKTLLYGVREEKTFHGNSGGKAADICSVTDSGGKAADICSVTDSRSKAADICSVTDSGSKAADICSVIDSGSKAADDICFVTIGFVEARKGQDLLVEAVKMLPKPVLEKCKFYIVGKDSSAMAGNLKAMCRDLPEIIFTGMAEDIHEYLNRADVLICPSREDPMPAVCAEAMMHELPCLVSDSAGTAAYIKEKENGLVFQSKNAGDLARQIVWCVENRQKLVRMGRESRKIYEENFSMDIFENNLLNAIKKMI